MSNQVSSRSSGDWKITKFIFAVTGLITAVFALIVYFWPVPPDPPPIPPTIAREAIGPTLTPTDEPTEPRPLPVATIPQPAQIARLQQETVAALKQHDLDTAKTLLQQDADLLTIALQDSPEDTDYLLLRGFHHKNAAQYRRLSGDAQQEATHLNIAEEVFQSVLDREPQNAEAWLGLGNVYLMRCQLDEAEKYMLKALDINPQHPKVRDDLALIEVYRTRCDS